MLPQNPSLEKVTIMAEHVASGFTYQVTKDGVHIATRHKQNWSPFLLAILSFLALAAVSLFLILRIVNLVEGGIPPEARAINLVLILILGLSIYILFLVSRLALDNAFLDEKVAINEKAITIQRSGFLQFKNRKVIPAERIQGIQPTIQISSSDSKLVDIFMNTSKISKISIATRQGTETYPICRGISVDDTVTTLDRIHEIYPQYF
jgi:membrane protein YdbS with pleckstrin-like domain